MELSLVGGIAEGIDSAKHSHPNKFISFSLFYINDANYLFPCNAMVFSNIIPVNVLVSGLSGSDLSQ